MPGLKDIQATLNSQKYPRIRFGIGNEFSKGKQINYVLGQWSEDELIHLQERIDYSVGMIKDFTTIGVSQTMSNRNNK